MKPLNTIRFLVASLLLGSTAVQAADTDIFLNPTSQGATNILVVIDSAGSVNANTTDIDGTSKKVYTVAANVIRALLDPATLKIKKSVFTANSIVLPSDVGGHCTKSPADTSGCACSNFGFIDSVSGGVTDPNFCMLPSERVSKLEELVRSVKLGIMLYNGSNSSGANGAAQKGGYVGFHVSDMSDDANRNNLIAKLADVPTGNGSMYAMSMYEAYKYFTNGTAENGFDGSTAYATNSLIGYDRRACGRLNNGAVGQNCASNATYTGPVTADNCNNAIVVIGPGSPDNSALERETSYLSGIGGSTTVIPTGVSPNYDSNMFDEYARYFAAKDFNSGISGVQPINTYTIMNDPSPSERSIAFMRKAGEVGGGGYYEAKNAVDFLEAFVNILSKVQSINSAFASVALPVSVNVRGTNLNQVYIGMFRPDKEGKPRWYGNLKEYQLALFGNDVALADADGVKAETTSGQLLTDAARSFWTHSSSFWNFSPSGSPSSGNDNPDGSVVEKGGAAQMMREQFTAAVDGASGDWGTNRKVLTCINCANGTQLLDADATAFRTGNASILSSISVSAINWCRGQDLSDENGNSSTTDARASFHGDVLHSRPAVINYNGNTTCSTIDDNDVYIFYGANDGFFRAVKGGVEAGNPDGGKEAWAFIPGEMLGKLSTLQSNNVGDKPYFVDGSIGSYIEYTTTTCTGAQSFQKVSKANVFLSMRRGGRLLYALDVTTPTVPRMLWKISNATPGFSKLGDTWSEPKSAKIKTSSTDTTGTPVVIFGGGYDKDVEDVLNTAITSMDSNGITTASGTVSRTMGNAIYVVRISDGQLLWRASNQAANDDCPTGAICVQNNDMDYAIPADVGIVDYNGDTFADRLYFGDTGANVWRANIGDHDRGNWTVYRLAQLNSARTGESASSARRKFLFSPDAVRGEGYDIVLVGSGDREQPFDTSVINRFYGLKDDGTVPASPVTDADAVSWQEVTSANVAQGVTLNPTNVGWFYTLSESGEKVVSAPITLNGITFFNTNIPRDACSSGLGEARIYAMNYETGKAAVYTMAGSPSAYKVVPGGGYLPTGVPVVVNINGKLHELLLVGTKVSEDIGVVALNRRVRTYWYQTIDQ